MWSKNEVGINAVIFILFTHHNFKLYLEWRTMKNEQCHSAFCVLLNAPAQDAILCWFTLWRLSLFSTYPPWPPRYPPSPHVCPHLLRPTQTHHNRNSKIYFQDTSKFQMEKSWSETHFWHARQIIAWENRNFAMPQGKALVASKSVICFVRLSK